MGELRVRRLDDAVVLELKERAAREGTSVEAILRRLITEEAMRPRNDMLGRLGRRHEAFRADHGPLEDSAGSIRDERDRWS